MEAEEVFVGGRGGGGEGVRGEEAAEGEEVFFYCFIKGVGG